MLSVIPPHFPLIAPEKWKRFRPDDLQVRDNFHDSPEMRWPGHIPESHVPQGMFSLVDMLATTLGLVGCQVPVWTQGRDFSPTLRGDSGPGDTGFTPPAEVLLEMVGSPRWRLSMPDWRGLVSERWKYAFTENRFELLFDLHADPFERHNLAQQDPEQCALLRARLLELLHETPCATIWTAICATFTTIPLSFTVDAGRRRCWCPLSPMSPAGYDTVLSGKIHFVGPDHLHGSDTKSAPGLSRSVAVLSRWRARACALVEGCRPMLLCPHG